MYTQGRNNIPLPLLLLAGLEAGLLLGLAINGAQTDCIESAICQKAIEFVRDAALAVLGVGVYAGRPPYRHGSRRAGKRGPRRSKSDRSRT
jgi:hypothetical protein